MMRGLPPQVVDPDVDGAIADAPPDQVGQDDAADGGLSLGPARSRRVGSQTIVAAIVLVVAGGVVYAMRRFGMGARQALASVKIEYDLGQASSSTENEFKHILDALDHAGPPSQIPVEKIAVNPFLLERDAGEPVVAAPPGAEGPSAEELAAMNARRLQEQRRARLDQIEAALERLQLNGVMAGGGRPVARINGRAVFVGDRVGDLFTVVGIEGLGVTLEAEGQQFTLSMNRGLGSSVKRSGGQGR